MGKLYPLLFEANLHQIVWGGQRLVEWKGVAGDAAVSGPIGESWEVSAVESSPSVVANGPFAGKTLPDVVATDPEGILGKAVAKHYGGKMPLLVKFIDAQKDLSIQVHPNDEMASREHGKMGKTEMWYIIDAQPGACIYSGFCKSLTPSEYKRMVQDGTITDALARYEVSEGDVFFIPAGRIHAIGAGCFVAEIQQTSDVTYRIYDFKRKDKNGNYRELHTELAAESIDYTVLPNYRAEYERTKNEGVQVATCPYFTTAVYDLNEPMTLDYSELDSFVILIAVKGEGTIKANGQEMTFRMGDTILLPATTGEVKVEGEVKFLETFV